MDASNQIALQEFRVRVEQELFSRGWERVSSGAGVRYVHGRWAGIIEEHDLWAVEGCDVKAAADSLERGASDSCLETREPLDEFCAALDERGMDALDVFHRVLGDKKAAARVSAIIGVLGSLDRDELGTAFDPVCKALLTALVELL